MWKLVALLAIFVNLSQGACPDGWTAHLTNCYIYIPEMYNWFNAQSACHVIGGILAEPHSAAENTYVAHLVHGSGGNGTWIGAEDIAEEGTFVWSSNNQVVAPTFWLPGQPDDNRHMQDCAMLSAQAGAHWQDGNCQHANHHFVCQKESTEDTVIG